jgi:hypothetical protein
MTVSIKIPDGVAEQMTASGKDLSRTALESLALEGYRNRSLSGGAVRELLGFATSLEVHEFLAEHGVELNYGWEDWLHDKTVVDEIAARRVTASPQ